MLNYDHLDIKLIDREVMYKADQFMETTYAKARKVDLQWQGNLISGAKDVIANCIQGAPITKEHLIAVILYTDFTQLSSDFTKTFRRKHPFEQKFQFHKRNEKFSKI